MREASQALVNLDELNEAAGAAVARMLGAEAAFVTAGTSAVDPINLQPGDDDVVAARLREELTRR